jgi:lysophospholipase L1-like esterase
MGLRGPHPAISRPPDEFRVLCLGDSVTFGLGVGDDETWPANLERFLAGSPRFAGRTVNVLNGGVPGWSSVQGMRLLDRVSWYRPDVIVFWFGMNDVAHAWGRPDAEKGRGPRAPTAVVDRLSGLRSVQLIANVVDGIRSPPDGWTRASVADFAAAVDRLRALERDGGPRVIFIRTPERLAATEAQLAGILDLAERGDAEWVSGPLPLLLAIVPAPAEMPIEGTVVEGPDGRELRLEGPAGMRETVEKLRTDLTDVRLWQRGLAERLALLPVDALDGQALFGEMPRELVFSDNCHLSDLGCRLAAEAIAARIFGVLAR